MCFRVLWPLRSHHHCHDYHITSVLFWLHQQVLLSSWGVVHSENNCHVWMTAAHADKALFTQLSLDTREVFLQYQHNSDAVSDVTFNVKDFRHMLSMCESLGASVAIRFDQPGAPLVVEPHFRGTHVRLTHRPFKQEGRPATCLHLTAANSRNAQRCNGLGFLSVPSKRWPLGKH